MDASWSGQTALWHLHVYPKIKIFLWNMLWNRLPTSDYIAIVMHSQVLLCPVCKCVEELADHIYFSCRYACIPWNMICEKFQLDFSDFVSRRHGTWLEEHNNTTKEDCVLSRTVIANFFLQLWINKNDCHYQNHQTKVHSMYRNIVAATIDFLKPIQHLEGNVQIFPLRGHMSL